MKSRLALVFFSGALLHSEPPTATVQLAGLAFRDPSTDKPKEMQTANAKNLEHLQTPARLALETHPRGQSRTERPGLFVIPSILTLLLQIPNRFHFCKDKMRRPLLLGESRWYLQTTPNRL